MENNESTSLSPLCILFRKLQILYLSWPTKFCTCRHRTSFTPTNWTRLCVVTAWSCKIDKTKLWHISALNLMGVKLPDGLVWLPESGLEISFPFTSTGIPGGTPTSSFCDFMLFTNLVIQPTQITDNRVFHLFSCSPTANWLQSGGHTDGLQFPFC